MRAPDSQVEKVTYPYVDASGEVAFEIVHFILPNMEFVRHRRPSGEADQSWILDLNAGEFMRAAPGEDWSHFNDARFAQYPAATRQRKVFPNDAPALPYGLPELSKAVAAGHTIYIVNNEKEVESFRSSGKCATCCAGDAENWRRSHSAFLRGADDVVLMLDSIGRDAAKEIARSLIPATKLKQPPAPPIIRRLRICENNRILELSSAEKFAATGFEFLDPHEDLGGRNELTALVEAARAKNGPGFAAAVREAVAVYAKTGRLGDAALVYGKRSIAVFPCDPATKVPIPRRDPDPTGKCPRGIPGTGGIKKATTDPIVIAHWWKVNPRALIAVAMGSLSGVWCTDVDTAVEHKDESVTAWDALLAEHEPFETREHRSASGGPHVFFKWEEERPLGCSPGQMPKGISIKGTGGYVIAPPSVRKGRSYTVFRDCDPILAPQWLIDKILAGRLAPKPRDKTKPSDRPPLPQDTPQCDLDELAEAMRFIPNDDLPWEEWTNWELAIFAASGGGQRGLEIFDEFSQKSHKYNANIVDQRWYETTGSPPNRTGAGKIFAEARRNGWQPKLKGAPPTYATADNAADPTRARDRTHQIGRDFLMESEMPPDPLDYSNEKPLPIARAVRVTVGIGKTKIMIEEIAHWLKNRTAKPKGPLIYATPRHNLNRDIEPQFAAHGINARIYYGRDAPDPHQPGKKMCLDLPAVVRAMTVRAEIGPTCCKNKKQRCQFFDLCRYQSQSRNSEGVQVWIVATDMLFHAQKALGENISAVFIDEGFWQKGIRGVEANDDVSVAVDSISNEPPDINGYNLPDRDALRHRLASALRAQPNDGGVERKHLDAVYLDGTSCSHALGLEWGSHNDDMKKLGLHPGMSERERQLADSQHDLIDRIQHTRRVIQIWEETRAFLNNADIEVSGRLTLTQDNGQRIVKWRGISPISKQFTVPTLMFDATLPPRSMLQAYYPRVEIVADLNVALPEHVHIRQFLGAPTSASKLTDERHLNEVYRHILQRWLELGRPSTVVICQQKPDEWLKQRLPKGIAVEHYNNVTGRDDYRDVRLMVLAGRTAPSPATVKTYAAALHGKCPVPATAKDNGFCWYDQVERGIRLRDGTGIATRGDQDPNPDDEAIRWQIHEGELVQALGRGRGVNRTAANPLDVDLLFDTCLPITVDEVRRWQTPSPLIETAYEGVMLAAPCDLVKLWPKLWPNEKAAYRTIKARAPKLPNFKQIEYQLAGPKMNKRIGYFDLTLIPDPRAWLETRLGQLISFQQK
jgi:Bifunctional DNA primase/polymerase, N-terminal/Primase C terminal 2 (PriCT-2)